MGDAGFRDLLGMDGPTTAEGRARVAVRADKRHVNPSGAVHGGVIATLVDIAMSAAVQSMSRDDETPVTIEMKVNYLEPGHPGLLVAVADVRKRGRRFTVVHAEVVQEDDDEVVAVAVGTFTTFG
jgi:uncharacterized protein (TIGR00369 family)